jgi:deoxyribonuclease-1
MPAHHFGQHRQCWREPKTFCPREEGKRPYTGRQCCERADPVFEHAHNDLHNLFPSVGEVNGDRSNYRWGVLSGEPRAYGQCDFEVDTKTRRAEPPKAVRGNIARVYFYMEETYGFNISRQQRQLFNAWHKQDPVDAWEKERNQRITKIQGKPNPFISGTMKPRP